MLVIAFLLAVTNLASSVPLLSPTAGHLDAPTTPIVAFGYEPVLCINFVHNRTIWNIVRSCLTTIFACTWVAVHPNIPRPKDSGWVRLKQRILIMVYAILAPEFIITWALRQRIGAARHMKEYNKRFHALMTPLSRSQAMWWHVKHWFCGPSEDQDPDELWTITHGFLLEMHGLVNVMGRPIEFVSGIDHALSIPECDILDKSKGDFLTKLLVLLQTTWFIFQCFARWIAHLPVTELEVVTLGFALLNIGTYFLWWNKPQNMGVAIQIDRYQNPKSIQGDNNMVGRDEENMMAEVSSNGGGKTSLEEEEGSGPKENANQHRRFAFLVRTVAAWKRCIYLLGTLASVVVSACRPCHLRPLKDARTFLAAALLPLLAMSIAPAPGNNTYDHIFYSSNEADREVSICILTAGTVFGGLHLVPLWSSSFPSTFAKILWQLCAGLVTGLPLITACLVFFMVKTDGVVNVILGYSSFGMFGIYLIARVVLIILAFATLRDLPPNLLRNVTWAAIIPHL